MRPRKHPTASRTHSVRLSGRASHRSKARSRRRRLRCEQLERRELLAVDITGVLDAAGNETLAFLDNPATTDLASSNDATPTLVGTYEPQHTQASLIAKDASGEELEGYWRIDELAERWRFTPTAPIATGDVISVTYDDESFADDGSGDGVQVFLTVEGQLDRQGLDGPFTKDLNEDFLGSEMVSVGNKLAFASWHEAYGSELTVLDTLSGDSTIFDLSPGLASSVPTNVHAIGNRVVFRAHDPIHGSELRWIDLSDSQPKIHTLDLVAGPANSRDSNNQIVGFDGKLYFTIETTTGDLQVQVVDFDDPQGSVKAIPYLADWPSHETPSIDHMMVVGKQLVIQIRPVGSIQIHVADLTLQEPRFREISFGGYYDRILNPTTPVELDERLYFIAYLTGDYHRYVLFEARFSDDQSSLSIVDLTNRFGRFSWQTQKDLAVVGDKLVFVDDNQVFYIEGEQLGNESPIEAKHIEIGTQTDFRFLKGFGTTSNQLFVSAIRDSQLYRLTDDGVGISFESFLTPSLNLLSPNIAQVRDHLFVAANSNLYSGLIRWDPKRIDELPTLVHKSTTLRFAPNFGSNWIASDSGLFLPIRDTLHGMELRHIQENESQLTVKNYVEFSSHSSNEIVNFSEPSADSQTAVVASTEHLESPFYASQVALGDDRDDSTDSLPSIAIVRADHLKVFADKAIVQSELIDLQLDGSTSVNPETSASGFLFDDSYLRIGDRVYAAFRDSEFDSFGRELRWLDLDSVSTGWTVLDFVPGRSGSLAGDDRLFSDGTRLFFTAVDDQFGNELRWLRASDATPSVQTIDAVPGPDSSFPESFTGFDLPTLPLFFTALSESGVRELYRVDLDQEQPTVSPVGLSRDLQEFNSIHFRALVPVGHRLFAYLSTANGYVLASLDANDPDAVLTPWLNGENSLEIKRGIYEESLMPFGTKLVFPLNESSQLGFIDTTTANSPIQRVLDDLPTQWRGDPFDAVLFDGKLFFQSQSRFFLDHQYVYEESGQLMRGSLSPTGERRESRSERPSFQANEETLLYIGDDGDGSELRWLSAEDQRAAEIVNAGIAGSDQARPADARVGDSIRIQLRFDEAVVPVGGQIAGRWPSFERIDELTWVATIEVTEETPLGLVSFLLHFQDATGNTTTVDATTDDSVVMIQEARVELPEPVTRIDFESFAHGAAWDTAEDGHAVDRAVMPQDFTSVARTPGSAAVQLDGLNPPIQILDSSDINGEDLDSATVSFWFRADEVASSQKQVLYKQGGDSRGINAYLDDGTLSVGGWSDKESWGGTFLQTDQVRSNQWHHVAIVLDNGITTEANRLTAYLDGVRFDEGPARPIKKHLGDVALGGLLDSTRFHDGNATEGTHPSPFQGAIDGFRFDRQALTPLEIDALATDRVATSSPAKGPSTPTIADPITQWELNEGEGRTARDSAERGAADLATLIGDATWSVSDEGRPVIRLDGNGYLSLEDSDDLNGSTFDQRTISLWFRADDVSGDEKQVLYKQNGRNRGLSIYLESGQLFLGGWSDSQAWSGTFLSTDRVENATWHHVTLVLDAHDADPELRGYLDGELIGTGPAAEIGRHLGDVSLGAVVQATRFHDGESRGPAGRLALKGELAAIAIYDRALEGPDIEALASNGAQAPSTRSIERDPEGEAPTESRPGTVVSPTSTRHNPAFAWDVNNDGRLSALDALQVINWLNQEIHGDHVPGSDNYVDTNNDGSVSAVDALLVINALNEDSQRRTENKGALAELESVDPQLASDAIDAAVSKLF
ncbi:MAG: LamG-like jellyroll fold domain-containing protein [Planctomycetota bacterium]